MRVSIIVEMRSELVRARPAVKTSVTSARGVFDLVVVPELERKFWRLLMACYAELQQNIREALELDQKQGKIFEP